MNSEFLTEVSDFVKIFSFGREINYQCYIKMKNYLH